MAYDFQLSEETRRLLDFLSQQRALAQQDPMAVLGDMQYIEGDRVVDDGGQGQGYQIPIANGTNTNVAWQGVSQQPRVVTQSQPATPEAYARVEQSPALDEIKDQLRRQIEAGFPAQTPPTTEEVVANALQAFSKQQAQPQAQTAPAQQAPARQEMPDAKTQIDNTVLQASRGRLLPPAPNMVQNDYRNRLIDAKRAYAEAELEYNAAQTPEDKQAALVKMQVLNEGANELRGIANEAGVDLTGYGEGVTLRDATRNLQSQAAKDFMHMYTGRYSMSSDQFYESEFERQMMNGTSAETAHRRAARAAREYKAKRVAYLNGLYNNYGLTNGQVTNQLGMQILSELAGEDPNRTNAYGTAYALPKDEYQNANKLAQLAIANDASTKRLILSSLLQDANAANADTRKRANFSFERDLLQTQEKEMWLFKQKYPDVDPTAVDTAMVEGLQLARLAGKTGDAAKAFARDYTAVKLLKGDKADTKAVERMQAHYNSLVTREKNILDRLDKTTDEKERASLIQELETVRTNIAGLDNNLESILNPGSPTAEIPPYTGNLERDIKTLQMIINGAPDASREDLIDNIKKWIKQSKPDLSDAAIDAWIRENVFGEKVFDETGMPVENTPAPAPAAQQPAPQRTASKPAQRDNNSSGGLPWTQGIAPPQYIPRWNPPTPNQTGTWQDYSKNFLPYYR